MTAKKAKGIDQGLVVDVYWEDFEINHIALGEMRPIGQSKWPNLTTSQWPQVRGRLPISVALRLARGWVTMYLLLFGPDSFIGCPGSK